MRDLRISLATTFSILICIGIIMIYSSTSIYALQIHGESTYYFTRHLMFLFLGFCLMAMGMTIDYRDLKKYAKPILFLTILMLILVLVPGIGKESNGARRWFKIGFLNFQPSEFAKIALIVYVAEFLSRKKKRISDFKTGFLPLVLVMGIVCALILKQPDMGTSLSLAAIIMILIFIAGANVKHVLGLTLLSLPALYLLVARVPYRMARIMAFLDPWQDAQGVGFQLSQSQIALGSGGLFGVGLGQSMQKLFYLPAAHTDFILSIIGEEVGLLGTLTVVFLFLCFIWQGAQIVKRTADPFGYYLSAGIVSMIGLQAVINIGVSIGALPTKGLPLPFISYGGSALIFNMLAVGLLLNVSRTQASQACA